MSLLPPKKSRVVLLNKTIGLDLYNELFPRICELRDESDEPIYLYLDSRGGNVAFAERLHELLKAPRHDGSTCTIVAVVPQFAASAAADLAILGDYCCVYPSAIVHCHGTRITASEITVDNLGDFDATLRSENENHAIKLAKKVTDRLSFLVWLKNTELGSFNATEPLDEDSSPDLLPEPPKIVKYFHFLENQSNTENLLSPSGKRFVSRCLVRWQRKSEMIEMLAALEKSGERDPKEVAKKLLEKSIANLGKDDGSVTEISRRMLDDSILLDESFPSGGLKLEELVKSIGLFFLSPDEEEEYQNLEEKEREGYLIRKTKMEIVFCSLFVNNLCQTLHEDENPFNAIDAYHLGLVDEIYGMTHIFPSKRSVEDGFRSA